MTFVRFILLVALVFGAYTLGAKAGKGRYREIRGNAKKLWNDPAMRKARKKADALRQRNTKRLAKRFG